MGEVFSVLRGTKVQIQRFQGNIALSKHCTGAIAAMPLWACESVDGVKRVQSAGEIVREVAGGAEQLLRHWG